MSTHQMDCTPISGQLVKKHYINLTLLQIQFLLSVYKELLHYLESQLLSLLFVDR
jgi:hypothetical protein